MIRVLHGEPVSSLPSLGYRLPGSKLALTLGGTFSTGEEQDFLCHGSGTRRGGQGVPLCTGPITSSAYRAVATFVPPGSGVGAGVRLFPSRQTAHYLAKIIAVDSDSDITHAHRLAFWALEPGCA